MEIKEKLEEIKDKIDDVLDKTDIDDKIIKQAKARYHEQFPDM